MDNSGNDGDERTIITVAVTAGGTPLVCTLSPSHPVSMNQLHTPMKTSHLLNSNVIPSPLQTAYIRDALSTEEATWSTLEREIIETQERLNDLIRRRSECGTKIESFRRVISIVRRIPPDVLEEIFFQCTTPILWPDSIPDLGIVLRLAHVCSLWRQVAINAGRLWSSLSFGLRPSNIHSLPKHLEEVWKRTHTLPIHLSILCSHSLLTSGLDFSTSQLILPSQSEYVTKLYMRAPFSLIETLLAKSSLLRLETLVAHFSDNDSDWRNVDRSRLPLNQLHHFTYRTEYSIESFRYIQIPWSQLTFLDIKESGAPSNIILFILSECNNLIDCRLFIEENLISEDNFTHPTIVVLLNLQKIHIDGYWSNSLEFFEALCLPALTTLLMSAGDLVDGGVDWSGRPNILPSLQLQSNFKLTTLSLEELELSLEGFLTLIIASPSLICIKMGQMLYDVVPGFLEILTYDPSNTEETIVAPRLESLLCWCYDDFEGDEADERRAMVVERAIAMVKSRWNPDREGEDSHVACLRSLTLPWITEPDAIRVGLQDCCAEGFSFSIRGDFQEDYRSRS